jgi:hypothetical protein
MNIMQTYRPQPSVSGRGPRALTEAFTPRANYQ